MYIFRPLLWSILSRNSIGLMFPLLPVKVHMVNPELMSFKEKLKNAIFDAISRNIYVYFPKLQKYDFFELGKKNISRRI